MALGCYYLALLGPPENVQLMLFEAIGSVTVTIIGINIAFKSNGGNNGIEICAIECFVDPESPIPKKRRSLSRLEEIDFTYIKEQVDKSDNKILLGDYEGALTNARNLIETICKYILGKRGEYHKKEDDLPKLYKNTDALLNMDPSLHPEHFFKETLSGCFSVINGLANIRNELIDSHGKSPTKFYRPAKQ